MEGKKVKNVIDILVPLNPCNMLNENMSFLSTLLFYDTLSS